MLRNSFSFVAGTLASAVFALAAAADAPDPDATLARPFTATYEGRFSGAKVEVRARLQPTADGAAYVYVRDSEPRGIVRMFRREGVRECALFHRGDMGFRSFVYDYADGDKRGGKSARISFDWSGGRALSDYKKTRVDLPLDAEPVDRLVEEMLVRERLSNGEEISTLRVIERNAIHDVHYEMLGTETIEIPPGRFETIVLSRRRGTSSRTTRYWHAESLGWLPVRIERYKNNKSQGTATLTEIQWNDAGDQARGSVTPVCP